MLACRIQLTVDQINLWVFGNSYLLTVMATSVLGLDQRFIKLDTELLQMLHKHFDGDDDIRNASRFCLETLFCGQLKLEGTGFTLTPDAESFYRSTWTDWAKKAWRDLWCFGFCITSWRPHERYYGIPRVIDLDQCDVYYYREVDNTVHFRVFRRVDRSFSLTEALSPESDGDIEMKTREIRDIEVFTLPEDLPDYRGGFNSVVHSLLAEAELYQTKLSCSIAADRLRCRPVVFLEHIPEKQSNDALKDLPLSAAQYNGNGSEPYTRSLAGAGTLEKMVEQQKYRVFSQISLEDSNSLARAMNSFERSVKANRAADAKTGGFIYVEDGCKLASGPQPEGPSDLSDTRTAKTERTFTAFGIPLTMLSNASSSQAMRKQTGQMGRGGSGHNSSSQKLFMTFQLALKNHTIDMIKRMYNRIYLEQYAVGIMNKQVSKLSKDFEEKHKDEIKRIRDSRKRKRDTFETTPVEPIDDDVKKAEKRLMEDWEREVALLDVGQINKAANIEVIIPGVPDDDELKELFVMGVLSYDYFTMIMSLKKGMSNDAWESKPAMNIKEMNGIVEKPEPSK